MPGAAQRSTWPSVRSGWAPTKAMWSIACLFRRS